MIDVSIALDDEQRCCLHLHNPTKTLFRLKSGEFAKKVLNIDNVFVNIYSLIDVL